MDLILIYLNQMLTWNSYRLKKTLIKFFCPFEVVKFNFSDYPKWTCLDRQQGLLSLWIMQRRKSKELSEKRALYLRTMLTHKLRTCF